MLHLSSLVNEVSKTNYATESSGKVIGVKGPIIAARMPGSGLGDVCHLMSRDGTAREAQVVSFHEDIVMLAPCDSMEGISPGSVVKNTGQPAKIRVSDKLKGQVLDAFGRPLLHYLPLDPDEGVEVNIVSDPPNPLERIEIKDKLSTGVKAIDGLCTIGYGQRIGLFAGPGAGKSTLLGMIARNADVDVTVIALVGERGREVNEFIQESLGEEGLKKSVLVVATSDETSLKRSTAAVTATAIAEYFRDQGKRVLLLVDSLTRTARSLRDMGLSAGELPVRQGYTPSVYAELPRLLERAGTGRRGSITAIYTVLTSNDQDMDPLSEEVKSLLDGHLVLRNEIARKGIRPAIDISNSVSRLLRRLHSEDYLKSIDCFLGVVDKLNRDKDIVLLGGTPDGELRVALELEDELRESLNQTPDMNVASQLSEKIFLTFTKKYQQKLAQVKNRPADEELDL